MLKITRRLCRFGGHAAYFADEGVHEDPPIARGEGAKADKSSVPQKSTNHTPSTEATGHLCYCACQSNPPMIEIPNQIRRFMYQLTLLALVALGAALMIRFRQTSKSERRWIPDIRRVT